VAVSCRHALGRAFDQPGLAESPNLHSAWGVKTSVRLLRASDVHLAARHVERHAAESGRGGDALFAPFSEFDHEAYEETRSESWRRPVDAPGWERCWAAIEDERVVGHLDLTGGSLYSQLHRARLGIGVERTHRGRGLGSRLLDVAIAWAREGEEIDFIDLSVFAHNDRAYRLYQRFGFVEIGRMTDAYRLNDTSIDDVLMTLPLR
jgi:RimJ/RimL family protein N-acetyltransferase